MYTLNDLVQTHSGYSTQSMNIVYRSNRNIHQHARVRWRG